MNELMRFSAAGELQRRGIDGGGQCFWDGKRLFWWCVSYVGRRRGSDQRIQIMTTGEGWNIDGMVHRDPRPSGSASSSEQQSSSTRVVLLCQASSPSHAPFSLHLWTRPWDIQTPLLDAPNQTWQWSTVHCLRLRGADPHPDLFALDYKPTQCHLEIKDQRNHWNHVLCKK